METLSHVLPEISPLGVPCFPECGCAGSCQSALEVGGDFFDVISLSDTSLLLVIADVMGKGLPAALFANTLQTVIRGLAEPGLRPAELLTDVNRIMFEQLSSEDIFITAQAAVVDLPRHELRVANAGHCPLLVSDGSDLVTAIGADGIPLGIQPDVPFTEQCVPLTVSSSVLLYTDGVTEARNSLGNFFGQQRLENWFRGCAKTGQTALQLKLSLLEQLAAFQGTESVADDQTFLVFCDQAPRPAIVPTLASSSWFSPWRYVKAARPAFGCEISQIERRVSGLTISHGMALSPLLEQSRFALSPAV